MTAELRPQSFEDGLAGLLELQEQRRSITAQEQADGTKRADAADSDRLKSDILEGVPLKEAPPFGRQAFLVGSEDTLGVDAISHIALICEMVDYRRLVGDAGFLS